MSPTRLSRSDHLASCCPMKIVRFPPPKLKRPKPHLCPDASDLSLLAHSNGQHSQEKPSTCEKALIKFTATIPPGVPNQLSSCDILEHYSERIRWTVFESKPPATGNHTLDEYNREDTHGDMARQRVLREVGRGRGANASGISVQQDYRMDDIEEHA